MGGKQVRCGSAATAPPAGVPTDKVVMA
jgi:hypothetical protein